MLNPGTTEPEIRRAKRFMRCSWVAEIDPEGRLGRRESYGGATLQANGRFRTRFRLFD